MFNPFAKQIKKVYGPYHYPAKKGVKSRRRIVVVFEDGTKTTMSWARWLVTQDLRRALTAEETVDHINEDPLDDRLENLQILSAADNARKHSVGKPNPNKGKERGWKHGTIYAWMRKKCDCAVCFKAKRAWHEERNAKRRKRNKG